MSTQNSGTKRETARKWYSRIQYTQYGHYAHLLKKRGFTYCQIMDYFAGKGTNERNYFKIR